MNRISLIIPSYKRPLSLKKTLNSLLNQTSNIDEVILIIDINDYDSYSLAEFYLSRIENLVIIKNKKASLINSLNLGLKICKYEIICLTDDDIELPEFWSNKVKLFFDTNPKVGAYGGPDIIILENFYDELKYNLKKKVGVFNWNTLIGNHHCGILESPSEVDVLKGVNLSFRRVALKKLEIDTFLESNGAEQCSEIDLCQNIKLNGYKIIYDNNNFLYHYPGNREEFDQRRGVGTKKNYQNLKNFSYIYAKFRTYHEIFFYVFNTLLIGTRFTPGFLRSILMIKDKGILIFLFPFKNLKPIFTGLYYGFKVRKM